MSTNAMGNGDKNKTKNKNKSQRQSTNRQSNSTNNINISSNNTPEAEIFQTTDVFGKSMEVLYGANVYPPDQNEQTTQSQTAHRRSVYNIPIAQNNATGQDMGRPIVMPINTAQHNGPLPQAYGGQYVPYIQSATPLPQAPAPSDNSISPWAANLCQQMGNIQYMLDGHARRWQTIENNISSQSEKLTTMENKLSEISNIKQDLVLTQAKVVTVEADLTDMQETMGDYNEAIITYSENYDDVTESYKKTNKKLKDIETRVQHLERKQNTTEENIQDTNEKLTDVRWRSMRENLLFFGIPECANSFETSEICESKIKDFIEAELKIEEHIPMDRVHRLGRYNRRNARPRPIVAKFTFYKDRERVRTTASPMLAGTKYGVAEQFPPEIEEKRKQLYGVAKQARENENNSVKLIRDKLYINGQLYKAGTTNNTNSTRQREDRDRTQYIQIRDEDTVDSREKSRDLNFANGSRSRTAQNGRQNESETEIEVDDDLTQSPNESQRSPSLLDNNSNSNNHQTPPPMDTTTLEPSPLVTLNRQTSSTGVDTVNTRVHETSARSAHDIDTD